MKLLIDTDAFCKLGVAGLLNDTIHLLGANRADCQRLAALPHMLRRGRLPKALGRAACEALVPIAEAIPVLGRPPDAWLDKLTGIDAIDPGEAQIYAAAAADGAVLVVSGDKRALRALKDLDEFVAALCGRVVVLEAALLALCQILGINEVRTRIPSLLAADTMVRACLSTGNPDPSSALQSYLRVTVSEVAPLMLWSSSRRHIR